MNISGQQLKREQMKKVLKLIDEIRNNLYKNKELKQQLTKYFCKLLLLKGMIKINEDLWQYCNERRQEAKFYTELFEKDINQIFELLQTMNKKYLLMLAYKLKAELVFHKAQQWGIQVNELKQAKKNFVEKALLLSKEMEQSKLQFQCKNLLIQYNEKIKFLCQCNFIILRSDPYVFPYDDKNSIIKTHLNFTYNADKIVSILLGSQKAINIRDEIFERKNLHHHLKQGCKILNLFLSKVAMNNLIGEYNEEDKIGFAQGIKISLEEKLPQDILILFLSCFQGKYYAESFQNLKIPYTIYFDYLYEYNQVNYVTQKLQELEINIFTEQFYNKILAGQDPESAFSQARQLMYQHLLSLKNFINKDQSNIDQLLGEGPKIIVFHQENNETSSKKEEKKLLEGKPAYLSNDETITNIIDSEFDIIGRNDDLEKILILEKKTINLYGETGVGKTFFVKKFGIYLVSKNIYTGVFYFDFNRLKTYKKNLYLMMKKELGSGFADDYQKYFQNKPRIFLIFDHFDQIVLDEIIQLKTIFLYLYQNEVDHIIVTQKQTLTQNSINYFPRQLKKLSFAQNCELLLSRIYSSYDNCKLPLENIATKQKKILEKQETPRFYIDFVQKEYQLPQTQKFNSKQTVHSSKALLPKKKARRMKKVKTQNSNNRKSSDGSNQDATVSNKKSKQQEINYMDQLILEESDFTNFPPLKQTFSLSNLAKLTSNNSSEYSEQIKKINSKMYIRKKQQQKEKTKKKKEILSKRDKKKQFVSSVSDDELSDLGEILKKSNYNL